MENIIIMNNSLCYKVCNLNGFYDIKSTKTVMVGHTCTP